MGRQKEEGRRKNAPGPQTPRVASRQARFLHSAFFILHSAVWLCASQAGAGIQLPPSDLVSRRSYSGQFVAYAPRSAQLAPALSAVATNLNHVQLEPTLVTVSCERIKQMLLRELNAKAPWRGTIYLVLYPPVAASDPITITSERFRNGWQYRVELPSVVERPRYVRAIVQVLLLELANRTAQGDAAVVPAWLVEGFTQLLLASNEVEIILPPPRAAPNGLNVGGAYVAAYKQTLLQQAEKQLAGRRPLTFEALSWPTEQDLADGAAGQLFRGSAQLFVGELLRLPDGRFCLQTMLTRLAQHLNWQVAFLEAFHAYFDRPLDVEKWWALSLAQANGRFAGQAWTLAESWQKLNQATHAAVEVRTETNQLPLHAEVSLQTVMREWELPRQIQALSNTLRELALLRLRIAQEHVSLVQDYYQAIEAYLQEATRGSSSPLSAKRAARMRALELVLRQLDTLDARRAALRPSSTPLPASASSALPGRSLPQETLKS